MKLLTVKQLADTLSVSEKTIYRWVELRQIPYLKLGKAVRFHPQQIERWLATKQVAPFVWDWKEKTRAKPGQKTRR